MRAVRVRRPTSTQGNPGIDCPHRKIGEVLGISLGLRRAMSQGNARNHGVPPITRPGLFVPQMPLDQPLSLPPGIENGHPMADPLQEQVERLVQQRASPSCSHELQPETYFR